LLPLCLVILTSGRLILLSLSGDAISQSNPKEELRTIARELFPSSVSPILPNPNESSRVPICHLTNSTVLIPRFPTFIIVGAQKAGTSALHHILKRHPDIIASRGLEPHFFDTRGDILASLDSDEKICHARNEYARFFDMDLIIMGSKNGTTPPIVFEKTPSYLLYPHIPKFIKELCPWAKIIISLRDPVERLHSSYLGDDFEDEVESQLDTLRRAGLIRAPPLKSFIPGAENASRFAITSRIRETQNQKGKIATKGVFRGLYSLQISNWLEHFALGKSLLVVKDFQGGDERAKVLTVNRILEFVGASPFEFDEATLNAVYGPNNGPNRKSRRPLRFKTKYYLRRLYRPYNEELAKILGDEWQGVWD
jgi:Sulfotransferase family